jgi:hypothetical protein
MLDKIEKVEYLEYYERLRIYMEVSNIYSLQQGGFTRPFRI